MTRHTLSHSPLIKLLIPARGSIQLPAEMRGRRLRPLINENLSNRVNPSVKCLRKTGFLSRLWYFFPLFWPPSPCAFLVVASPSGVLLNLKENVALPLTNERNEIVQTASRTSVAVRYGSGMSRGCLPASSNYLVERRHSTLQ